MNKGVFQRLTLANAQFRTETKIHPFAEIDCYYPIEIVSQACGERFLRLLRQRYNTQYFFKSPSRNFFMFLTYVTIKTTPPSTWLQTCNSIWCKFNRICSCLKKSISIGSDGQTFWSNLNILLSQSISFCIVGTPDILWKVAFFSQVNC